MSDTRALRKRCPRCKKVRRFCEPPGDRGGERPAYLLWVKEEGPGTTSVWVCRWCTEPDALRADLAAERECRRRNRLRWRPRKRLQGVLDAALWHHEDDYHLWHYAQGRLREVEETILDFPPDEDWISMLLDGAPLTIPTGRRVLTSVKMDLGAGAWGDRRAGEGLCKYSLGLRRGRFTFAVEHAEGDVAWYDLDELSEVQDR